MVLPLVSTVRVALALAGAPEAEGADAFAPPPSVADCDERLTRAGVRFSPARIPVHASPDGSFLCGAPQIVRYRRGPGRIRYGSSPKLTCQMALAMARFEEILQEEAQRVLGRRVARIEHAGTYNCRAMAAYPGWVSEHSFANAIDIRAFVLTDGRRIVVREHYGDPLRRSPTPRARFLRTVAGRLFDEGVFSVVLTPAFDGLHRSHFHLDKAPYRVDGTKIVDR